MKNKQPLRFSVKDKLLLFVLVLLTILVLLPQLQIPWMLIDDGTSVKAAAELTEHFSKGDWSWLFKLEAHNGYLRPTYWFSHWLGFSLLGTNVVAHHLIHLLVYAVSSVLIFLLTREISGSSFAALLAGIFNLLFYPAAENLYRLGTNEPTVVLYLLAALFGFIKAIKENSRTFFALSVFSLILAWFNKPTMIVLAPFSLTVFGLFWLFHKDKQSSSTITEKYAKKYSLLFFITNGALLALLGVLFSVYQISGGYGSQYLLNFQQIKDPFLEYIKLIVKSYGPLFYLLLGSFMVRFYLKNKIDKKQISWESKWELLLFILFMAFILIQIPWSHIMARYLPPALVGLSVILGIEFSYLYKWGLESYHHKKNILSAVILLPITILFAYAMFVNVKEVYAMYQRVVPGETRRAVVVKFLAQNTPENGRVFYNFSDGLVEFLHEMGIHFQYFQNRSDIKTAYLFLDNGYKFKEGDIIVSGPSYSQRYPWEQAEKVFEGKKELQTIDNEWKIIQITKDQEVQPVTYTPNPPEVKNLLGFKRYSYTDGQKEVKIPITKYSLVNAGLSFSWKPPADIGESGKKISLIRQDENVPRRLWIFAGKDYLSFNIMDPWKNEWRTLKAEEEFSPDKVYKVILGWGKAGMNLTVGSNKLFLPYYAGINLESDLIVGSKNNKENVSNKSGELYDFILSVDN